MRIDKNIIIDSQEINIEVHQGGRNIDNLTIQNTYALIIEFTTDTELNEYQLEQIKQKAQIDLSYFEKER